jgi:hypothetical protein
MLLSRARWISSSPGPFGTPTQTGGVFVCFAMAVWTLPRIRLSVSVTRSWPTSTSYMIPAESTLIHWRPSVYATFTSHWGSNWRRMCRDASSSSSSSLVVESGIYGRSGSSPGPRGTMRPTCAQSRWRAISPAVRCRGSARAVPVGMT